jgi:hypothetical protein
MLIQITSLKLVINHPGIGKQKGGFAFAKTALSENEAAELQVLDDVREDVTDSRAEQSQDNDDHDGHQNQDQSVFDEALAFFTGHVQHNEFSIWNMLTHNDLK